MRRRVKTQWLCLTVFATVFFSGAFLFRENHQASDVPVRIVRKTTESSFSLFSLKHVTKSLAELGKMDEVNKYFLFLNHVPKCGSEILILLLQRLQGPNSFKHVRLTGGNKRHLKKSQQENLVYEMYGIIRKEAIPLSFDRHVYFINFTKFDRQQPTYINLIRDPVDKVLSRGSYKTGLEEAKLYSKCLEKKNKRCNLKTGPSYDLSIPYFCRQDPKCTLLNSEWALQTAKNNVEKYYPVVGVLEELNATLEFLEHQIPYFFKGVQEVYKNSLLKVYKKKRKLQASKDVRDMLKDTLAKEYEFYEWIKSRLFKQLQMLSGEGHSH